tara:strand:+ start:3638 stop:3844 length:207 start_codon:yes stop_codon:yes gene_type:complete
LQYRYELQQLYRCVFKVGLVDIKKLLPLKKLGIRLIVYLDAEEIPTSYGKLETKKRFSIFGVMSHQKK